MGAALLLVLAWVAVSAWGSVPVCLAARGGGAAAEAPREDVANGPSLRLDAETEKCTRSNIISKDPEEMCRKAMELCQSDGLVDYYRIYYCHVIKTESVARGALKQLLYFSAIVVGLFILFRVLGTTADDYLAPTMAGLCRELGLPPRFAGVTFLALASGAPDVSATVAAIRSGEYLLSLGALTGAAMFVTCVVAGGVIIVGDGAKAKGALCRETAALMITSGLIFIVFRFGKITRREPIIFLLLYAAFCSIVLFADIWHRRSKIFPAVRKVVKKVRSLFSEDYRGKASSSNYEAPWSPLNMPLREELRSVEANGDTLDESDSDSRSDDEWEYHKNQTARLSGSLSEDDEGDSDGAMSREEEGRRLHELQNEATSSSSRVGTVSVGTILETFYFQAHESTHDLVRKIKEEGWKDFYNHETLWERVVLLLESPFILARVVTVPSVDTDFYFKPFFIISSTMSPWWILFCTYSGSFKHIPYSHSIPAIFGSTIWFLATTMCCRTDQPPKWKMGTSFPIGLAFVSVYSFCLAALWINLIANELVSLVTFIGSVSGINSAILGLTVIAWGNSVGDFSTNMAMARKGLGNMAITASFAGPLFNILVGLGIGFLCYFDVENTSSAQVEITSVIGAGFIILVTHCITILSFSIFNKQHVPKSYGFVSLGIYAFYMLCSVILVVTHINLPFVTSMHRQ